MIENSNVVIDFETTGLEWHTPDFRVVSMAVAYRDINNELRTEFFESDKDIRFWLKHAKKLNANIVVYNASFEYGILASTYQDVGIDVAIDCMRLVQLFDSGGSYPPRLGLKDSVPRILGHDKGGWEKPVHEWILANIPGAKKNKVGAYLSQAPTGLLDAYNRADVERTYELMEHILVRFSAEKYNWTSDMAYYLYMVRQFAKAKTIGIAVSRDDLTNYIEKLHSDVASIDERFTTFFSAAVKETEGVLHAKAQSLLKKKILPEGPDFNPGSYRQLELLFCEVLKQQPKILTPTGRPSFKTKYLAQWGEGGIILAGRAKAKFTIAQSTALLEKSFANGRWHPDISPGTTVTGRNRTFGGLNILALDRRDKGFMSTMVADLGQTLVSIDLVAGEPTVVAHLSGDRYYRYATVDGVGKIPKWDNRGVLLIDDIYLMLMSQTPIGRDTLKAEFSNVEWAKDPESVKSKLKKLRQLHKIAALGMSYGMGPKKLQTTFLENGYDYDIDIARGVYKTYWSLFSDVKWLADELGKGVEKRGHLVNPFGFRCVPEKPHLAFNYMIQSTVNHLMAQLCMGVQHYFPEATLVTCIHDELIFTVPSELVDDFKNSLTSAVQATNDMLGWSVPVRVGWATGLNLYEAK